MSRKTKNVLLLVPLVIYVILYQVLLLKDFLRYSEFISAAVIIVLLFASIMAFGWQKDKKTFLGTELTKLTAILVAIYFVLSYGSGLLIGFLRNSYSLQPVAILNNIFAPIIIIVCVELFRYVMIKTNRDSKATMVMTTILLAIFESLIAIRVSNLLRPAECFKIITSVVMPIITRNAIMSYLTYHSGYKPTLIYRLLIDTYIFIVPIVPSFSDYVRSIIGICFPMLIFIYSSRIVNEFNNNVDKEFNPKMFTWGDLPVFFVVLLLGALISGYFTYYMIGVGSGSMSPNINKGDAVVVKKIKKDKDIKEGDILAFKAGEKIIIHRLAKKDKNDKGETVYITKGDANNSEDNQKLTIGDVSGKVLFRIPYIAWPTIYVTDLLEEE